jgi:hypothetical protein
MYGDGKVICTVDRRQELEQLAGEHTRVDFLGDEALAWQLLCRNGGMNALHWWRQMTAGAACG